MIDRKKKLLLIQLTLFTLGVIIIIYTYFDKKQSEEQIISPENQRNIISKLNVEENSEGDIFYNIKYSGIDLAGNRYILTSKEAINNKSNPDLVNMKFVEVNFYFKDETFLKVISDEGVYNNKTLDMIFEKNVKAFYEGTELYADKANYSNLKSFLTVTDNVIVVDQKGNLTADKLLFDIKKQSLNIISFNNNKINAKINLQ
tara:strand:- start:911 stop:1516 length:606 start_codon:yes stop_codon:yes gene_type:complete